MKCRLRQQGGGAQYGNLSELQWQKVFTQIFKDPCGLTALTVLSTCPVPETIAGMTEEQFLNLIKVAHEGRLMRRKLIALHKAALVSIGVKAGAHSVSIELSFLMGKFLLIKGHIRSLDQTLTRLVDETLAFALVKKQVFYQVPQTAAIAS